MHSVTRSTLAFAFAFAVVLAVPSMAGAAVTADLRVEATGGKVLADVATSAPRPPR